MELLCSAAHFLMGNASKLLNIQFNDVNVLECLEKKKPHRISHRLQSLPHVSRQNFDYFHGLLNCNENSQALEDTSFPQWLMLSNLSYFDYFVKVEGWQYLRQSIRLLL